MFLVLCGNSNLDVLINFVLIKKKSVGAGIDSLGYLYSVAGSVWWKSLSHSSPLKLLLVDYLNSD